MKPSQEMYPDCTDQYGFSAPYDYGPLLASIGPVVVQVDDKAYQGDSRVLYRDGERWGVLLFGWGSCSGCDALQQCDSHEEIEKLRDELANTVRWGSREETAAYLRGKDFETESTYREEEIRQFVSEALRALEAA